MHARIVSNTEPVTVVVGRTYRADSTKRPVVWAHAANGDHLEPWLPTNNCLPILEALTGVLGLPVAVPRCGGPATWGNDTAQGFVTDALALLRSSYGAHATKDPLLVGVSMGGLAMLNWSRAHPVRGLWLAYPATHLQALHDGTGGAAGGGTAGIEAAYGGSPATFNAAVAAHDPSQNTGAYASKPMRIDYSTADTVVGTANQQAFINSVGTATAKSLGAVGHADMTRIDPAAVVNFLGGLV